MEQGNTAPAVPGESNPGDVTVPGQSSQAQDISGEGQPKTNYEAELAVLKERYSHSSQEGKRLAEHNKMLEQRLHAIEQRSLTQNQVQEQGYPDEDSYVQKWVQDGDITEKQARLQYKTTKILWDNQNVLQQALIAEQNRNRFERELREKSLIETSPEARDAVEFSKGIPSLEALPTVEKIRAMKELRSRSGVRSEGRDLSAVKAAASGSPSGGSSRQADAPSAEKDSKARAMGFPHWRAVEESNHIRTPQEWAQFKSKYKMK